MDLPRDEAARLAVLRDYDILDTPAEEEFDDLARLASSICGVPIALINLVDVDRLWSKARVGIGVTEMPRSTSVCTHTIQGQDLLIVRDLRDDRRFAANPLVAGDAGLRFYAGAPLITPGGQALGTLCVLDRLPRDLTEQQQDALRSLARQVMTQFELRRTVAELRRTVTAREEAEAELRQREAHFHSLIDNALDIVTVLHGDGTISFQSPSIERLLGYRPQERLGRSFFELVHPDDRDRVKAAFVDLVRRPGAVATVELRLRHADGSWRSLEASGRNMLDDEHVRGVVVNARDITARKAAEEELRRQHAVTSTITGSLGEGVYALDRAGRLTFMNPAAERMLGWRQEELLGAPMHEAIHYQYADGTPFPAATCPLLGVLCSGTTVHGEDDVFTRKDGVMIPVAYTSAPIMTDGQVTGAVLTFSDSTERRRSAAALRAAKEEAERANAAKSEFLSRMSHELRTPLNAILGFGQLLEMDALSTDQHESVEHILKGGRHLLELINEVLDIARIEAGRLSLSLEPVGLRDVVDESLDLMIPLAAQQGIALRPDLATCERQVHADRQKLKQVLLNLLSNAVKYTERGGTVWVTCTDVAPARVRIAVRDTGRGIAPEKLDQLFLPFERLGAEATTMEGTGLGLALSKRLAEAMGGILGVDSLPGQGSTFWLDLPAAPDGGPLEAGSDDGQETGATEGVPAADQRVVYIEDNLANLTLIEHILAVHRPGVMLVPAMQGSLGVEIARQHHPHLILLDLNLPDAPGDEVLRWLQADPLTSDIPVVVLSADASPGQVERLLAAGARAFLTKPLEVKGLLALLDESLQVGAP